MRGTDLADETDNALVHLTMRFRYFVVLVTSCLFSYRFRMVKETYDGLQLERPQLVADTWYKVVPEFG